MTAPVILVCGFGRCGSSLMMQMLRAGGVPVTGEWPAFEDDHASPFEHSIDATWLASIPGAAVKVLDPHKIHIPIGSYRAIWMARDAGQQAQSQAKFAHLMMGLPIDRRMVRALSASYRSDRPAAFRTLTKAGAEILQVGFEDLLNPASLPNAVDRVASFLGRPVDRAAMVSAVRSRDARCAPGLDMELALMSEGAPA